MRKLVLFLLIVSIALYGCTSYDDNLAKTNAAPTTLAASASPLVVEEMPPSLPTDEEDVLIPQDENPTPPNAVQDNLPPAMPDATAATAAGDKEALKEMAHVWRIYSARLFYDIGGAGSIGGTTRTLELAEDGKWNFGDGSHGTWSSVPIVEDDWKKWGVEPYGPARKIVLDGWNDAVADGPIEEGTQGADFFWVIYRNNEQGDNAGQIQMKFGYR